MSQSKKAYFQGGGGVNEPTPKKKKYKSDPALVMQPRFKEPFYRNYDPYETEGEHTPGAGWHHMNDFKSVKEFLEHKRKRMKDKYKADDSWQLDSGERTKKNPNIQSRAAIFNRIVKVASHNTCGFCGKNKIDVTFPCEYCGKGGAQVLGDENHIDFPVDEQIDSPILGDSGTYSDSVPIGGQLDEYLTLPDFEGKSVDKLNFGHDYEEDGKVSDLKGIDLEALIDKYLNPAEPHLYGLPDGISPPEDLDAPNEENPQYGETESGNTLYDKMWI